MATNIGTLMATVGVDTRPLKKGLKDAERQTEASTTKMLSHWKSMAVGVAATFALYKTASFVKETALLAARFETLGVVMKSVGGIAGYSAAEMNHYDLALRKTGISMIESRQSLSRMAQAQLDLSKATQLGRIAQDAAVIGNINSSEAFQRMIYGIQSGNLIVLKTIGINVSFEQSYKDVAAATGRARESFSEAEKAIIRQNAVVKYGARIAGTYEAAMGTAGKKLTSFVRYVEDFKVKMGKAFGPATVTLVDAATSAMKEMQFEISRPEAQESLRELSSQLAEVIVQLGQDLPKAIKGTTDAISTVHEIYNSLPEGVVGAAGAGLIGRMLFGSWTPAAVITSLSLAGSQMDKAFQDFEKREGEVSEYVKWLTEPKELDFYIVIHPPSRLDVALEDPDKYYGEMILHKKFLQEKLERGKEYYDSIEALAREAREEEEEEADAETMRFREELNHRFQIQKEYYDSIEALAREAREEEEEWEEALRVSAQETADYQKKIEEEKYGFMRDAMRGWALDQVSTLNEVLWGAETTFEQIAESFAKMITEMLIRQAMLDSISWLQGLAGGNGETVGEMFGGMGIAVNDAKGHAYEGGKMLKYAKGGIVNSPTQFRFADGIGLMGEAGAEAIMPLTRLPGGDLGVKSESDGGGSVTNITINAVDSQSFAEAIERNPGSVVSVIDNALTERGALLTTVRNTI